MYPYVNVNNEISFYRFIEAFFCVEIFITLRDLIYDHQFNETVIDHHILNGGILHAPLN